MPAGRPSDYTDETAEIICRRLAEGESLKHICDDEEMPSRPTVYKWLNDRPEFLNNYTRAREEQADYYFEQVLEIADNEDLKPDDKRVRVDARKWVTGKLRPKKYGDRSTVDMNMNYNELSTEELEARLAKLEAGNN